MNVLCVKCGCIEDQYRGHIVDQGKFVRGGIFKKLGSLPHRTDNAISLLCVPHSGDIYTRSPSSSCGLRPWHCFQSCREAKVDPEGTFTHGLTCERSARRTSHRQMLDDQVWRASTWPHQHACSRLHGRSLMFGWTVPGWLDGFRFQQLNEVLSNILN